MTKRIDKAMEVAKATMVGDLRDVMLAILKDNNLGGKTWAELKEGEQRQVVDMLETRARSSVVRAIDIIASEGRRHIKVILKQVTIKDGLKGVFECSKGNELRHDLIDAQGENVLVVLTNTEQYLGKGNKVKIDKDQRELIDDEDDEEDFDEETGEIE